MKIILLRHGKPNFTAAWLSSADDARQALQDYANSRVTTPASHDIQSTIGQADVYITSQLPRSIDSLRLLGIQQHTASTLFNESELPCPNRLAIPLPWDLFSVIYRLLWLCGVRQNCPGKTLDRQRAASATKYLIEMTTENGTTVLVGHGIMNRLMCTELQRLGWHIDSSNGSGYWSFKALTN